MTAAARVASTRMPLGPVLSKSVYHTSDLRSTNISKPVQPAVESDRLGGQRSEVSLPAQPVHTVAASCQATAKLNAAPPNRQELAAI